LEVFVRLKVLSEFCRRVGTVTRSGVGLLAAIKREASRQRDSRFWFSVVERLESGESFTESLRPHQAQLGDMFIAMIEVGEESGHLSEMLIELADYYDELLRIKRDFLKSLIWPVIELAAAVVIVSLVILLLGVISGMTGQTVDILGFGLVGFDGFVKYWVYVGVVLAVCYVLFLWTKKSVGRLRFVHYLLNRIPKVGALMRSLAYMRLAWGLDLTMRTGMDVERSMKLSFNGVNYAPVSDNLPIILGVLEKGGDLMDAFSATKNIDYDLITCIDSGEQSGTIPELMQKMTERYLQESLVNLKTVSVIGGFLVYGAIMAMIALLIFRIASYYIGMLNSFAL
jgi:type IV pilus assembly protein PilC